MTNPYNFVHFIKPTNLEDPPSHSAIDPNLKTGVMNCRIIALSPIFIPFYVEDDPNIFEKLQLPPKEQRRGVKNRTNDPHKMFKKFFSDANGNPIIPGSSLKGTFRAVAEAACNGCVSVFNGVYAGKERNSTIKIALPAGLEPCSNRHELCPTCRLFGMSTPSEEVSGKLYFKGKVTFSDARLIGTPKYYRATPQNPNPLILPAELASPNPRHSKWYLEKHGRAVGRKFYYHHDNLDIVQDRSGDLKVRDQLIRNHLNLRAPSKDDLHRKVSISPLDSGSCFEFQVNYFNLTEGELALLVFALELYPNPDQWNPDWPEGFNKNQFKKGQYHKIGYGKPAGLGTCAVYIINNKPLNLGGRYSDSVNSDAEAGMTGKDLMTWINENKRSVLNPGNLPANQIQSHLPYNIQQLLKITIWPNGKNIAYPSYNSPDFNQDLPTL